MMTLPQHMTADAEVASARYGLLVEGWRSLYAAALDQPTFGTQKQMDQVSAQAYGIARSYLAAEERSVEKVTSQYALNAQQSVQIDVQREASSELADAASEHLSANNEYLMHEISVQIERDIAFLKQSLRQAYLSVTMAARAGRIPVRTALAQYRIGNAAELHFFFHDRRNQRWPSTKFIRAVWRQNLIAIYNETVLLTLADHGLDTAQITHSDPKSPHHGTIISMDSNSALPTYAELKPVVFHPNSEAILGIAA